MKTLVIITLFLICQTTKAQDPIAGLEDQGLESIGVNNTAILLARLWVNEAGFETGRWRDHAGIADVIRYVGGGTIDKEAICDYSRNLLCRKRSDRRSYINYLDESGEAPEGWPGSMNWENYRARWLRLIRRAEAYIRWTPVPCLERVRPRHWGAPGFRQEELSSAGWTSLTCPGAYNVFWAPEW